MGIIMPSASDNQARGPHMGKPLSRELAAYFAPRIMRSVRTKKNGCWIRTKGVNPVTGYTSISRMVDGKASYYFAHRVMYVFWNGPIPEGLTIDHLCEQPSCCNPAHLRAVPHRDNVLRSLKNPAAIHARKLVCDKGHAFTQINNRKRKCLTCARERDKAKREERAAQGVPDNEPHGTRRAYMHWSCRCEVCREWCHLDYLRRKEEARAS